MANNFFGYHSQTAGYSAVPSVATQAYQTAGPGLPAGVPTVQAVQPQPVAGYTAVNHAAAAQQAAAASAATGYRTSANAAAQQVATAAYSAYQPVQQQANTVSATYAAPAAPVVSAGYPANSYPYAPPTNHSAAVAAAPAHIYDTSKQAAAYYQQPSSVAAAVTYSVTDPHYQSRPVYSTNTNSISVQVQQRPPVIGSAAAPRPSYTASYVPSTPTTSYTYGAAAQSIAPKPNIYVQPAQPATINLTPVPVVGKVHTNQWVNRSKPGTQPQAPGAAKPFRPRVPPKPQQLHYCEVCKISCAGPQTYKEHLEGQKHKKKEAAMKTGTTGPTTRGGNALRCELCDVTCTGSDAYAAHIRGAKHQKVVKLHTKLGKPIPSIDPVLVTKGEGETSSTAGPTSSAISVVTSTKPNITSHKTPSVPKITFVGAGQTKNDKNDKSITMGENEVTIPRLPEEKDVQPVGHDYIEEIKNEEGKVVSFNCKLCECRFNDPNAKEMHMKGRRHRLQYKKKVNPDLVVDVKPSLRQRKMAEERQKRSQAREEFWRRREEEFRLMEEEERAYWEERRRFEEEQMDYYNWAGPRGRGGPGPGPMGPRFGPPGGPGGFGFPPMMRRPDTIDDRHVLAKHAGIYPSEEQLNAVQKIVSHTEKALKLVSDSMTTPEDKKSDAKVMKKDDDGEDKKDGGSRMLKGVMRVGVLAKGLLLKGDKEVRLVVLCGEKPNLTLLNKICDSLPKQLNVIASDESYEIVKVVEEAAFIVKNKKPVEFPYSVHITLTSPLVREEPGVLQGAGLLDRDKCLDALAALRHAKWFQARAAGRQSCVMVIRILRDFCERVPTWWAFKLFPMELMVEKVLASAGCPLSPGDALRRVFEALAGGLLLPDSPGFLDPCEKEPQDAAKDLSSQDREDITASAQHALRLIAFRQIHKVLGMESLPPPKFGRARFNRKRRRDDSMNDSGADGEAEEKKDKKDDDGDE